MRKTIFTALSIIMLLGLILSGCATPTPQTIVQTVEVPVVETQVVVETQKVVETQTVVETVEVEVPSDASGLVLPRNETLYFNGIQWGAIKSWNPYSSDTNNAMAIGDGSNNYSVQYTLFETPYMYNMLDGKVYPLLADGDYTWNDDLTEITFKIKPAAKWSDGTQVTADDVAYTFASHIKYETNNGAAYKDYIETVEALDPQTVVVKAKLDASGKAVNPLQVAQYLSHVYVIQKAWTETLEGRA
ncbi:MAG: ABC transporter substrate-binding protein, partial [Anaerolineales bacterium]